MIGLTSVAKDFAVLQSVAAGTLSLVHAMNKNRKTVTEMIVLFIMFFVIY
jgi:hypothetical protein